MLERQVRKLFLDYSLDNGQVLIMINQAAPGNRYEVLPISDEAASSFNQLGAIVPTRLSQAYLFQQIPKTGWTEYKTPDISAWKRYEMPGFEINETEGILPVSLHTQYTVMEKLNFP